MTLRRWLYRNIYLKSAYWRWIRGMVGQRAGWKCQVRGCSERGRGLNAHHVKYHLFMEWLNLRNLIWLCPKHHSAIHSGFALQLTKGRWLKPYSWRE